MCLTGHSWGLESWRGPSVTVEKGEIILHTLLSHVGKEAWEGGLAI